MSEFIRNNFGVANRLHLVINTLKAAWGVFFYLVSSWPLRTSHKQTIVCTKKSQKTTSLIGNRSYSNHYMHMYSLTLQFISQIRCIHFFSFNMTAYIFMLPVIKLILFSLIMIFSVSLLSRET